MSCPVNKCSISDTACDLVCGFGRARFHALASAIEMEPELSDPEWPAGMLAVFTELERGILRDRRLNVQFLTNGVE